MSEGGRIRRWDVYLADLEPTVGHEQRGVARPVIIVSNDGVTNRLQLATVVPLTKLEGKPRRPYPFEVSLPTGTVSPGVTSIALPQQLRTISTRRLKRRVARVLEPAVQRAIENRLLEQLGIEYEAEMEPAKG